MAISVKNVETPDDKRNFEHSDVKIVGLPGMTFGYAVFNPGWRWSSDVKRWWGGRRASWPKRGSLTGQAPSMCRSAPPEGPRACQHTALAGCRLTLAATVLKDLYPESVPAASMRMRTSPALAQGRS